MTVLNFQFWAFVGVVAGIYTIFALGVQLQFGFTGLLNFGHVAFMAIGAYTMAILVVKTDTPLWLASLAAIGVAIGFGLVLGLPTLRLRADYLAITTIAFSETIRYVAHNEYRLTGGAQGTSALGAEGQAATYDASWRAFQTRVEDVLRDVLGDLASKDVAMLVIVWAVALVLVVALQWLVRTPWGRVLKGIRDDEEAASALGKNVFWYKLQSLAIGAVLGAIAGLFYAFQFSFFSPGDFEPLLTFFAWTIVILGGTGRVWGVPVGALVFGLIFAGTRFFDFAPFSLLEGAERAYVRLIVIGLLLVGLVAFRPQGLFGKRQEMVLE
jgi:ABC-type branched-subunit amino acid transport system permease subunit